MKPLIIIDTYPSELAQIEILEECVTALKRDDADILIVSHLPIPERIVKMVKYCIYDHDNTFLLPEYTPFFWLEHDTFDLKIYNGGHTLPICRNMRSSISFAQAMGYKTFIFMEYDVILSLKDYSTLMGLMYKMDVFGKKMLFFKPEEYRGTNGSYVYETLLFGGYCEAFLEKFMPPLDLKEWVKLNMGYTLEQSFYEQLGKYEDEFLIVNEHSSETFTSSKVNLMRYGLFNCEVVNNVLNEEEPVLFIINSLIEEQPKYVDVFVNGDLYTSHTFYKGFFWFNSYKFDGSPIFVIIYNDEQKQSVFMRKSFDLSITNKSDFKQKGFIKFKP